MDLLQSLANLKDLILGAKSQESELQARIIELQTQRKTIISAPLNRMDTESALLAALTAQRDRALADPDLLRDLSDVRQAGPDALSGAPLDGLTPLHPVLAYAASPELLDRLSALLTTPDEVLRRMKPALDRLDWSTAGMALSERRKRITAIDRELTQLQTELTQLQASLAEAQQHSPALASNEPAIGTRRQFDNCWATWTSIYPGQPPGWLFDQ